MLLTSSDQKCNSTLAYTTILIVLPEHVFTCAQSLYSEQSNIALEVLATLLSIPSSRVRPLLSPHRW